MHHNPGTERVESETGIRHTSAHNLAAGNGIFIATCYAQYISRGERFPLSGFARFYRFFGVKP